MGGIRMARLRPMFNAVADVDYGPTTDWAIRYSIASYKTMLGLFLREYITGTGPWTGPLAITATLYADAAYTGGVAYSESGGTNAPYSEFRLGGGVGISRPTGNAGVFPEYYDPSAPVETCPIDAISGLREDANWTEFAGGSVSVHLDLKTPHIPQADWASATHVWLPFNVGAVAQHSYPLICQGSGVAGNTGGGPFMNENILGIDYAAGGGGFGIPPTGSIALGDGTTKLFLWSPTGQRFELVSLDTNNF